MDDILSVEATTQMYTPPALLQRDGVDTSSANVHPCTFADGEFLLCKNVAIAWNHGHPCPF